MQNPEVLEIEKPKISLSDLNLKCILVCSKGCVLQYDKKMAAHILI